ncbi:nucleolar and coiled-body phosphoprotein 1-like [Lytechinus pictus]|uniref:nucleolar and coiled-body phosphoprotein 1-like n=1 Tax=Lytechinus pictus TaxID=7653 RepID=UPI00240E449F|nr:nucleolar and coiled-body phosphoprotein 1-like [Lytechinus pictus]
MKRSTDMESSGSESDAEENTSESESESEESEVDETPPPSPPKKKSYSLMNQIRKVQKEMPQMAPSTPSFREPPSVENPLSNSRVDPNEGSKHPEQSAESGDNEDHDSFSKYNTSQPPSFTDFHQLIESSHDSKASPSSVKSKGSSKSSSKPLGSSKPTVKRPQTRTDNSSGSKTGSAKDTSSSSRVKSESNSKESSKAKSSKQSSKSASSISKKSPGPGAGAKSSTKTQEKKPGQRAKQTEKRRVPKSIPLIDSDSDSEDERTPLRPSSKAVVNTSTSSSSSSSSGNSSLSTLDTSYPVRQPKVEPESGKRMPGVKKGDNKYMVKPEPLDTYEHRRPPFDDFAHMDPIVSPIRADFVDEQSRPLDRHPEIQYDKNGKPSVFVRLRRDLFDHLPKSSVFKFEQNVPGPSTQKRKDSTDPPEKPLTAIVKPVKRKQTELEKEKSGNKRSRIENKSPRRMREDALRGVRDEPTEALEPFVSSESSLDRRQSSDRRGSVSSMTSQPSSHSSRRGKNDCDPHHPSSRSKRDSSRGRDFASQRIHDWTSPEHHADRSVEMPHNVALGGGGGEADPSASSHRNGGLSHSHSHSLPPHAHHSTTSHPHRGVEGEDWRVFPPAESYPGYGEEAQSRHRLELDER